MVRDPDWQRSWVWFPPRTNICVMSMSIYSVSGCNLSLYINVFKTYSSMFISFLVTIIQALLSLGSDSMCKLSQDIYYLFSIDFSLSLSSRPLMTEDRGHNLFVCTWSESSVSNDLCSSFVLQCCWTWWQVNPSSSLSIGLVIVLAIVCLQCYQLR